VYETKGTVKAAVVTHLTLIAVIKERMEQIAALLLKGELSS